MIFDDVLTIKNGKNQRAVENPNGRYPIYGSGGVMGYADDYICNANTVIVGRKGSINNPIFVEEPFWNVDTAFGLEAKREVLLPKYLYYFCKHFDFERLNKAVTIPSLTKGDLLKIEIDLPIIEEQQAIIDKLLGVEAIIDLRKQELQKLDELIKARFVEMFGNGRYEEKILSELTDVITKGTTPTTAGYSFLDEGVNFFKIESIRDDHSINLDKVAHVGMDCHNAFKRSQLIEGDILFSIAGAIGRTAIIQEGDLPGNTNQALAIIRLSKECGISQRFLISALGSPLVVEQYNKKKRGIAQINLSLQDIGNLRVIVPPIEEQERFAEFCNQLDKSKVINIVD